MPKDVTEDPRVEIPEFDNKKKYKFQSYKD